MVLMGGCPPSPPHKYLATAPRSAAAKAVYKFTVRDFRADCLRELKKLSAAWPDQRAEL